jgi:hypothetical protein
MVEGDRRVAELWLALTNGGGALECWQQPKLPAWEVLKRNPQERRPRAPEWEPEAAEIAELAALKRYDMVQPLYRAGQQHHRPPRR